MNEEKYLEAESSQRQHHEVLRHQEEMYIIGQREDFNLFSILKPKIFKDGNQWCVLYGDNIQEGIAGFGETPHEAILNWNKEWYKN